MSLNLDIKGKYTDIKRYIQIIYWFNIKMVKLQMVNMHINIHIFFNFFLKILQNIIGNMVPTYEYIFFYLSFFINTQGVKNIHTYKYISHEYLN